MNHLMADDKVTILAKMKNGVFQVPIIHCRHHDVINLSLIPANFPRRNRWLKFVKIRKGRCLRDQQREIFHFGQMPKENYEIGRTQSHIPIPLGVQFIKCCIAYSHFSQTIINQYTRTTDGKIYNLESLYLQTQKF